MSESDSETLAASQNEYGILTKKKDVWEEHFLFSDDDDDDVMIMMVVVDNTYQTVPQSLILAVAHSIAP